MPVSTADILHFCIEVVKLQFDRGVHLYLLSRRDMFILKKAGICSSLSKFENRTVSHDFFYRSGRVLPGTGLGTSPDRPLLCDLLSPERSKTFLKNVNNMYVKEVFAH